MRYIVRLQSIELNNFKNVEHGVISLPGGQSVAEALSKTDLPLLKSNILGIYGQNGSGKTAVIDSLHFLQQLLRGTKVDKDIYNYIQKGKDILSCSFSFFLLPADQTKEKININYSFAIQYKDEVVSIKSESLKYTILSLDGKSSTRKFIDYNLDDKDYYEKFMTDENIRFIKRENKNDYEKLKAFLLVNKSPISFIFNDTNFECLTNNFKNTPIYSALNRIKGYSFTSLFVIRNNESSDIMSGNSLRLIYLNKNEKSQTYGNYIIKSRGAIIPVKEVDYYNLTKIIDCQNIVLQKLIPGLTIKLEDKGTDVDENNENLRLIALYSDRNGIKVPLGYESDGIKKIIYILRIIIDMYNDSSVLLAIDEFDSGIFEYLLGELIKTLEFSGKGQLLFTSHNLRPLELLNPKSLYYTTINPKNRYTQINGIRESNNGRKVYYTAIQLGSENDEDDDLYEMIDTDLIADALEDAGNYRG